MHILKIILERYGHVLDEKQLMESYHHEVDVDGVTELIL